MLKKDKYGKKDKSEKSEKFNKYLFDEVRLPTKEKFSDIPAVQIVDYAEARIDVTLNYSHKKGLLTYGKHGNIYLEHVSAINKGISAFPSYRKLEPNEIEEACSHAWEGNFLDLKAILRGVHLHDINAARNQRQQSILYCAARNGHFELTRWILSLGVDISSVQAPNMSTPLHGACFGKQTAIVALLIAYGADTNALNSFGRKPAEEGPVSVREIITYVEQGKHIRHHFQTRPSPVTHSLNGNLALDVSTGEEAVCAAWNDNIMKLKALLNQTSITTLNQYRSTEKECSVLYAACKNGALDVVNWLLKFEGLEINTPQGPKGTYPLHAACSGGKRAIVVQLLLAGADTEVRSQLTLKPIEDCSGGTKEIIEAYIQFGYIGLDRFERLYCQQKYLSVIYGIHLIVFKFRSQLMRNTVMKILGTLQDEIRNKVTTNFDELIQRMWAAEGGGALTYQQVTQQMQANIDPGFCIPTYLQTKPKITFEEFSQLVRQFKSIKDLFPIFANYAQDNVMTVSQFASFLSREQHEKVTEEEAALRLKQTCPSFWEKSHEISFEIFSEYLLSESNAAFDPARTKVHQPMNLPLSRYLVSSSHNTYCTSDQLYGKSSSEMYARALTKENYRCIELDMWDSENGGTPDIYHGYTLTSKIKFRDVVKTISENAFVTSPYPVILSFENHACYAQQEIMANDLTEILGSMIGLVPEGATELPSPEALQYKILIKGSKNEQETWVQDTDFRLLPTEGKMAHTTVKYLLPKTNPALSKITYLGTQPLNLTAQRSPFEISSATELTVTDVIGQDPKLAFQFCIDHTLRIYPKGLRFDSSNYDPMPSWLMGIQMVALNLQTCSTPTMINQSLFQGNGSCGYYLKHKELPAPGDAREVNIRFMYALSFPEKKEKTAFLKVSMNGLSCDIQELPPHPCEFQGGNCNVNFLSNFTVYGFEHAILTFRFDKKKKNEDPYNLLGWSSIPLNCLRDGYRQFQIFDRKMNKVPFAIVFAKIEMSRAPERPQRPKISFLPRKWVEPASLTFDLIPTEENLANLPIHTVRQLTKSNTHSGGPAPYAEQPPPATQPKRRGLQVGTCRFKAPPKVTERPDLLSSVLEMTAFGPNPLENELPVTQNKHGQPFESPSSPPKREGSSPEKPQFVPTHKRTNPLSFSQPSLPVSAPQGPRTHFQPLLIPPKETHVLPQTSPRGFSLPRPNPHNDPMISRSPSPDPNPGNPGRFPTPGQLSPHHQPTSPHYPTQPIQNDRLGPRNPSDPQLSLGVVRRPSGDTRGGQLHPPTSPHYPTQPIQNDRLGPRNPSDPQLNLGFLQMRGGDASMNRGGGQLSPHLPQPNDRLGPRNPSDPQLNVNAIHHQPMFHRPVASDPSMNRGQLSPHPPQQTELGQQPFRGGPPMLVRHPTDPTQIKSFARQAHPLVPEAQPVARSPYPVDPQMIPNPTPLRLNPLLEQPSPPFSRSFSNDTTHAPLPGATPSGGFLHNPSLMRGLAASDGNVHKIPFNRAYSDDTRRPTLGQQPVIPNTGQPNLVLRTPLDRARGTQPNLSDAPTQRRTTPDTGVSTTSDFGGQRGYTHSRNQLKRSNSFNQDQPQSVPIPTVEQRREALPITSVNSQSQSPSALVIDNYSQTPVIIQTPSYRPELVIDNYSQTPKIEQQKPVTIINEYPIMEIPPIRLPNNNNIARGESAPTSPTTPKVTSTSETLRALRKRAAEDNISPRSRVINPDRTLNGDPRINPNPERTLNGDPRINPNPETRVQAEPKTNQPEVAPIAPVLTELPRFVRPQLTTTAPPNEGQRQTTYGTRQLVRPPAELPTRRDSDGTRSSLGGISADGEVTVTSSMSVSSSGHPVYTTALRRISKVNEPRNGP